MMQNDEPMTMAEPAKEVEFYFIVAVEKDGTIQTYRELPQGIEADRPFNTLDVFKVAKEIVSDIEAQLLADRVIGGVLQVLQSREQSVSEKVANALKERGVEFNAGEQKIEFSADNTEE
jgi:hypothetical protein